jgi:hypothetical protein
MLTNLRIWWTRTGSFAREIVAKRAGITTALGGLAGLAVTLGLIPVDLGAKATGYVTVGLGVIASLAGILWTRTGVTPAALALAPTSAEGIPLVPAGPLVPADPAGKHEAP